MTMRVLYQALGMSGYSATAHWRSTGRTFLKLTAPASCHRCPKCGNRNVIHRGTYQRSVHAPNLGMDRVRLFITAPRLECRECQQVLNAKLPSVEPGCQYTHSFARLVVDLRKMMTIKDVARYLGVSESMIRGIDKKYLKRRFGKVRLRHLRVIAIDEIYLGQKHKFITIVIDWETGAVVYVGKGKGEQALTPFWNRLRGSKAKIQAVATDMSSAYFAAVLKNLPKAKQVFDHFHVIKLMNEKLTELRRDIQREAIGMGKDVLKGLRWLLLKRSDHLDKAKGERERLQEAFTLNASLAIAYYLKESLGQVWQERHKDAAEKYLMDWCQLAEASGIKMLLQMAKTLRTHRQGILNWYDFPISNGKLEGINNKIGAVQRQAYGYRDYDYFQLKLHALHESKFALIG